MDTHDDLHPDLQPVIDQLFENELTMTTGSSHFDPAASAQAAAPLATRSRLTRTKRSPNTKAGKSETIPIGTA